MLAGGRIGLIGGAISAAAYLGLKLLRRFKVGR
jgi:hypothetical protein